jgi:hypothetical protein
LGSAGVKALNMLVKLIPVVNVINEQLFAPISLRQKFQSQTVIREKLRRALFSKKVSIKCC